MISRHTFLLLIGLGLGLLLHPQIVKSATFPEHEVKTAFLYNFAAFVEWPDSVETTLTICTYGEDLVTEEINKLDGRRVNERRIIIQNKIKIESLKECQIVFIADSMISHISGIIYNLQNKSILIVANSQDAAIQGATINMSVENKKVIFEVNLETARRMGITISSKLLRLANKIYQ